MIYLDNAATSFPKPETVYREARKCMECYCGNPGRSSHRLSLKSAEKIYEARELISDFFVLGSPENVIFTYNDTYALNMALKGLLKNGDHIIIGDMEHNSVYRPIEALRKSGVIDYSVFETFCFGTRKSKEDIISSINRLIRPNTKALICSHSSNICSLSLPALEIGALCREKGIIFILDAAQSAGHLPVNMSEMNIDILCAPAHKGLFGIQGCGFLLLNPSLQLEPFIEGGSGVNSLSADMPDAPPERYEAGTLATPSIAALCEGVKFVAKNGVDAIHEYEETLYERLSDMLLSLPEIKIYAPYERGSVLLFNVKGIPAEKVAKLLDEKGICVRSGFHCSPLGHNALETGENGAVRISFSVFNTFKELDYFFSSIKRILS